MRYLLGRVILLTLMIGAMALGGWLGTKMGFQLLERYRPPTKPKSLMEPLDKARYEREGLAKMINAFKALEAKRWDLPLVITPRDLASVRDELSETLVAKREGPLFKMKPPKRVKKEEEKEKPKEERKAKPEKKPEERSSPERAEPKRGKSEHREVSKPQERPRQVRYYIQVGVFSMRENANFVLDELRALGLNNAQVVREQKRSLVLFRVLVGPFETREQAEAVAKRLNSSGYSSYIIER